MQELEKTIEILDKLSFFGGQRAGRELWNNKPREVQDEDIANFNRDIEYLRDIIRKHINDGWIPAWKPPESEKEVLILTDRGTITTAIYEDGTVPEERSIWAWTDIDFIYDEDNDINYIPKGWWEYRHFNPDDIYNNAVNENVIAWQPLPEPCRPERSVEE